jgi:hypothetical protein
MLSIKEQIMKENIERLLGNRPEAELIFKAQTGKITKQEIEEYERKRDEDTEYFKELFHFDKPQEPSIIETEPNKNIIISNEILKDKDDNQISRSEIERD